jgi:hypothetical protein
VRIVSNGTFETCHDRDGNWHEAYGVETDGAVLVRPDGYVAWRSRSGTSEPGEVLRAVFDGLLGRIRFRDRFSHN